MINCKRCDVVISFENGLCFSFGIPHDIRQCITIPRYVWCPAHRAKFSKRHPCTHYMQYGYEINSNEEFFIKLINENYQNGDWFNRRNRYKKSGNKMKKSICNKCDVSFYNLTEPQQKIHEQMHKNKEKHQNTLLSFFN